MNTSNKLNLVRDLTIAFCFSILTINLMASPLSDAKSAGLVQEVPDGYVAAVDTVSADISALVKDINERRKDAYAKIAKETGITVEQVGRESYIKRHPPKE